MPVYQYKNGTGEVVELVRPVADRDMCPPGFQRVTVPVRVAISGAARDPYIADTQVPRAFRQLEEKVSAREIVKESGFSIEDVKRIWSIK